MPRANRGRHLWRDARGTWHVRWFEAGTRRTRSTGCRDRVDAEKVLAALELELARPALPPSPTLADVLVAYAEHCRFRHSYRQIESKCRHVAARIGHLRVAELRQPHVRAYVTRRSAEGRSSGTIGEELRKLRAALRWAAGEGLIETVPLIRVPLGSPPRRRYLTREECDRLVAAAVEPHVRLFVLLALHTGARSGAILELAWQRVDLDRGVVDFGHKEGGKARASVPTTTTLLTALREAHACRRSPWVIEYAGERVRTMRTGWRNTLDRAGIAHCTRHDLRRTAGSLLVQSGVPMEVVARVLGHAKVSTTAQVYAHLRVEDLRAHLGALDVAAARGSYSGNEPRTSDQKAPGSKGYPRRQR